MIWLILGIILFIVGLIILYAVMGNPKDYTMMTLKTGIRLIFFSLICIGIYKIDMLIALVEVIK